MEAERQDCETTETDAWESTLFLCEIRICGAVRLALQYERMNARHSPGVLRRARTMSSTPCGHASVVDRSQRLCGNLCTPRDLGQCCGSGTLLVKASRIGGCLRPNTLVTFEWDIGPRVFPGHASSASGRSPALFVCSAGESPRILGGPVHCLECALKSWLNNKWAIPQVETTSPFIGRRCLKNISHQRGRRLTVCRGATNKQRPCIASARHGLTCLSL